MPLSTYLNLGLGELAHTKLTIELADRTVKIPKGIAENVLVGIGKFVFPVDFIILDMPEDVKVPLMTSNNITFIATFIPYYYSDILYVVSIKEDTAYLCLHFTRNYEELKSYTSYPEDSIRHIEDYLKILEDIERGHYS
ncbi:hypothetical protein Tco_0022572 [Tanacetum coccineum]